MHGADGFVSLNSMNFQTFIENEKRKYFESNKETHVPSLPSFTFICF